MYQQLSQKEFVSSLGEILQERRNGVLFLVTEGGGWGKIEVQNGELLSLNFKSAKGSEALPLLKALDSIQFLFQEQRGAATQKPPAPAKDNALSKETFFGYFGVNLPSPTTTPQSPKSVTTSAGTEPQPMHRTTAQASEKPHRGTVLVVDDSALARKAARIPLESDGFRVVEAKDGFEALGQMQNECPGLILLDLVMPGMDGYRVLELVRANPKFSKVPVIMLTSRDGLLDKIRSRVSDLDEYLTKPFDGVQLSKMVAKHLMS